MDPSVDAVTSDIASGLRKEFFQEQPSSGVLRKRFSENIQQIYRRTPMPKCDFNKVALLKSHFGMGVLL